MVPGRAVEMSSAEYIQKVERENPVTAESGGYVAAGEVPAPPGSDADAGPGVPETGKTRGGGPAPPVTNNGKDEGPHRRRRKATPRTNAAHVGRTDPDARIYGRPGQPNKPGYIDCITVDSLHNIITGVEVIPGDGDEARVLVPVLTAQVFKFGFWPESVSGDKGHGEARVHKELCAPGKKPFIPRRNHKGNPNIRPQERFQYDRDLDLYICPAGKTLRCRGCVDRGIMKVCQARPQDCKACPYKPQCTTAKRTGRTIKRQRAR